MKLLAAVYAGFLIGIFATLWSLGYQLISWECLVILGLTAFSYVMAWGAVEMIRWANALRKRMLNA